MKGRGEREDRFHSFSREGKREKKNCESSGAGKGGQAFSSYRVGGRRLRRDVSGGGG